MIGKQSRFATCAGRFFCAAERLRSAGRSQIMRTNCEQYGVHFSGAMQKKWRFHNGLGKKEEFCLRSCATECKNARSCKNECKTSVSSEYQIQLKALHFMDNRAMIDPDIRTASNEMGETENGLAIISFFSLLNEIM